MSAESMLTSLFRHPLRPWWLLDNPDPGVSGLSTVTERSGGLWYNRLGGVGVDGVESYPRDAMSLVVIGGVVGIASTIICGTPR